jgi:type VI secretion system protein VasD
MLATQRVATRTARIPFAVLLGVALTLLEACGGMPKPPLEIRLTLQVVAASDVNPDRSGRASPVAVSVLQLKTADAFLNADFFAASNPTNPELAADVASRDEITLNPGETREVPFKLGASASSVGVIAAFRDIEHASWRAVMPLPAPRKGASGAEDVRLIIRIDARKVSIEAGSP